MDDEEDSLDRIEREMESGDTQDRIERAMSEIDDLRAKLQRATERLERAKRGEDPDKPDDDDSGGMLVREPRPKRPKPTIRPKPAVAVPVEEDRR